MSRLTFGPMGRPEVPAAHQPYKKWQQPIRSFSLVKLDYPIKCPNATGPSPVGGAGKPRENTERN